MNSVAFDFVRFAEAFQNAVIKFIVAVISVALRYVKWPFASVLSLEVIVVIVAIIAYRRHHGVMAMASVEHRCVVPHFSSLLLRELHKHYQESRRIVYLISVDHCLIMPFI